MDYPKQILHWINGAKVASGSGAFFDKHNPATGEVLSQVTRGNAADVARAINAAEQAHKVWSSKPVIARSDILRKAVFLMMERKEELAEIVAIESGKSKKDALGEVGGAIECGFFYAGEGRRYFGQVLQSSVSNRHVYKVRQPVGIGVLITPFNNPAAGIAWKLFAALLCGNAVVIKSHEYTPYVALWYAKLFKDAGLPQGVISVLQGFGAEVGTSLVEDSRTQFISLTGSAATGAKIIQASANRLAKVSIEAGGKNPFVVCDDADIEKAVSMAILASFVDGGQRCSATSRIIIFSNAYEQFKKRFIEEARKLKVGASDTDNYGAIISEKRLQEILSSLGLALKEGAVLLTGGKRIGGKGYFMEPTVLEGISPDAEISCKELFGPVVVLYKVETLAEAIEMANKPDVKLSSAIHTSSLHRAQEFISGYRGGVVRVNGPTHRSEPHMPFGGTGLSGNGWREPGTDALDFYSDWKQVSIDHDPSWC